ncbi:hypothetical protein PF008_g31426 [Phytophthora fragariae]|uniref:Uncharacterized protein n=1 Tax=Phytophthora fragariae TaxID=53985 RepID=A0A6G0Q2T2_9STRA|nr:hypothetical protein PF008_g31426 [Phytophthora fragariae]
MRSRFVACIACIGGGLLTDVGYMCFGWYSGGEVGVGVQATEAKLPRSRFVACIACMGGLANRCVLYVYCVVQGRCSWCRRVSQGSQIAKKQVRGVHCVHGGALSNRCALYVV